MSSKPSSGQWQKVSGTKKSQKSSKKSKKDLVKKLPKIEDLPPLDILPTSFESLNPKEKPVLTSIHAAGNGDAKPSKKKQQKPTATKFKFTKLSDAVNKVSFDEVIKKAAEVRNKLANADQLIYLKEIVTIYNVELSCPDEPFTAKPSAYPYSLVPKKTQGKLLELFVSSTSENDRKNMFQFCLENMLKCVEKDQCSWGMQICLQVLASNCPSQLCVGLNKHLDDILRKENVPKRCLAYMWALGNFGMGSPKHGLQVWLKVMMNLLHLKNLAPFALSYIEQLMQNDQMKKLSGVVTAQEFVDFLSWTLDSSSSLNKNLQARLQKLYPKIKKLALPGNCCQVFEIFLKSSPAEISSYKETYVDVAMECLQNDIKCFSVWRQYYTDTFPMTRELLVRINSGGSLAFELDDSALRKTIQAFDNTNCDAAQSSQSLTSKKEFKDIYNICNDFQEQLNHPEHSTGFSMLSMSFAVLLIAILGTFFYDLYHHNFVVEKTITYVNLQSVGVIKYLALVWKNIKIGSLTVFQWAQTSVFPTLSKLSRFLFPYILSFGEMLYTAIQWILVHTEGVRDVLAMYARVALEWLCSTLKMDDVGKLMWPYVTAASQQTIEFMSKLISGEISWCCVKGFVYNGYVIMSNYAATLWTSAVDFVSGTQL